LRLADYQKPQRQLTAGGFSEVPKYAFDATNVLIAAINSTGIGNKAALAKAIRGIRHEGASGTIAFDANGQSQAPIAIELKTVRGGQWVDYPGGN